ncbi:hypothetical protein J2O02_18350 (plasmid) [Elizabethkingia anophelis]|uniref:hypothetical protein n=1 Tax=Elizabethkingia anophelis TaxID=1117645 RepID=UPI0020B89A0A|nr:hypothetical protein [Elizabethkingia anophelis]UTG66785.1 hypothetical protein J2O02_18350 [Elizabethkingia anophelis]
MIKTLRIISFLFISLFSAQSYVIGDSQSFLLAENSVHTKIFPTLSKVGIGVSELNQMLEQSPVHEEVKNIFISIGVNDNYFDKGINKLITNLERVFPNSYLFAIKGSYGWGNVKNVNTQTPRYIEYYNKFKKVKIYVIEKDVGYGDPHQNKAAYAQIGDFIDYIVWKNHMREKKK